MKINENESERESERRLGGKKVRAVRAVRGIEETGNSQKNEALNSK